MLQHDLDRPAAGALGLVDIAALLTLACGLGMAAVGAAVLTWRLMG